MKGISRVFAEIDLDIFKQNVEAIADRVDSKTALIGVIKADGYGHGAVPLARELEAQKKVSGLAVATVEEGVALRRAGIQKPLLVLGYTFPDEYEAMLQEDICATAFTDKMLADMGNAAVRAHKEMRVHIAVDTGMSRIGIRPDDTGLAFVRRAHDTKGICVEGIFTHFARADEADKTWADIQLHAFCGFLSRIEREVGLTIPVKHCSNSAAIMEMPKANLDAVRAGIILYGLMPSDEVNPDAIRLRPVLSLYSHIAYIKDLEAGRQVSYGGTYTTPKPMRVATIPVGYGDGYPRGLSNCGDVLIGQKRVRILGRVCMDQFMVDVTDIPQACVGQKVTLIGRDGVERITMEELGRLSGRFNYELACCLGPRIPRIYKKAGKQCDFLSQPAQ